MHSHFWKSMTRTATLKPTTKSPEISNSLQMNLPLSAQMQEGWKKKEKKERKEIAMYIPLFLQYLGVVSSEIFLLVFSSLQLFQGQNELPIFHVF